MVRYYRIDGSGKIQEDSISKTNLRSRVYKAHDDVDAKYWYGVDQNEEYMICVKITMYKKIAVSLLWIVMIYKQIAQSQ